MKTILLIFSICFSLQVLGQTDSLIPYDTSGTACERGQKMADFIGKEGKRYVIFEFGLQKVSWETNRFNKYYNNYLLEKYNIEVIHGGCMINMHDKCFSDRIKEVLLKKYGKDFFKNTRKEAKKLFDKSLQMQIDTGYVFILTDSMPQYVGGEDSIFMYLDRSCRLYNSVDKRGCSNPNGTVYCRFIVEKDGSITNYKIVRSLDLNADNKVLESMKIMPNWKPATINDQPVRCTMVLPFKFSQK